MDCKPRGHPEVPTQMIKLKSSDGEVVQIEIKVAHLSSHLKQMLDDLGIEENDVIPIPPNAPEITGATLKKIIDWANHHKDDPVAADDDEKEEEKPVDDISSWDAEFLKVDLTTLFQIIRAANFLDIKGLLDVTCKAVAKMIKGMTLEEVCQRFNIQNDFSLEEQEQIRRENAWCDDFNAQENTGRSVDGNLMNKIPADSVKDMGNEGNPVLEDCFKNSVVVTKILQHFSNRELLKLSTLNKLWSYEARLLMRKRGNVMARLVCHSTSPCQQVFEAFGANLEQMNVVPYSGMIMTISPKSHAIGTAALDPTYEVIKARLALKHLDLRLAGKWWKCKDCTPFLLLKNLLQHFSGLLEQFTLDIEEEREEFVQYFLSHCSFTAMKVLKLQDEYSTFDESYTNYMRALVLRTPKLRELHTLGPINLMENVLEGSEAVLMPQHEISAPFDEISESVVGSLRLKDIQLVYTGPEFNLDQFNRMAPMLLQGSGPTTLESMNVDGILAVPLMCYGISLENVKDLVVSLNYIISERCQPHLLETFKYFDFTRIFPNLEKVGVYYSFQYVQPSPVHMLEIIMKAMAVLREPLPGRAENIKELTLYQGCISTSAVQFFAEMFSNIQKLAIQTDKEEPIPFGSIWEYWKDLIELEVEAKLLENAENLDSIFCGIFPEEVAQLREMDEEYLKRVNIVPVMPAITSMKNLRTFSLKLSRHEKSDQTFLDDGTFMFSMVTGLIAFARCPSLEVKLEFWFHGVLPVSHLKPFADVKCVDLSDDKFNPERWELGDMSGFMQQLDIAMGVDFESD